ncbi:MAG: hypothetical protein ACK5XN_13235 [Bacteroidota bacterium]|jgi:hypothetical protein
MTLRKALREQFTLNDDMVVHLPTGAKWTAHPKDPQLAAIYMSRLGSVLENGDEYDRREAHFIAVEMLEKRIYQKA